MLGDNKVLDLVQDASGELLSLLMTNVSDINAALISTADGFEVASKYKNNANTDKLCALSSSLSAIGNMATEEVEIGKQYQHVMIESDDGFMIVMDIPYIHYPMILCIVASKKAMLARVFQQARSIANTLTTKLPEKL